VNLRPKGPHLRAGDDSPPQQIVPPSFSRRHVGVAAPVEYLQEVPAWARYSRPVAHLSLYRDRINLNELNADLQRDKLIRYVIPQDGLNANAAADLQFSLGAGDGLNETHVFTPVIAHDGDVNYKLGFKKTGRCLPPQAQLDDYHFISLSGFGLDNYTLVRDIQDVTDHLLFLDRPSIQPNLGRLFMLRVPPNN
jgi:hypothetical protein